MDNCYGQVKEVSIEQNVLEFLDNQGEFNQEPDAELVYCIEIVNNKRLSPKAYGFYRLGVTASHSNVYFMSYFDSEIVFYTLDPLNEDFLEIITILKSIDLYTENEKFWILESIVKSNIQSEDMDLWIEK